MPSPKCIGGHHKSGTWNNQVRKRKTPRDNRCFNCKYIHSKGNYFSSPVIPVTPLFNNSVINPTQTSSIIQQSSRSLQNNTSDNRWFSSKYGDSKSNGFSPPVIRVPPPLNDSVINPPHLSSVFNSHPALHWTRLQSRKLLQYMIGLHLIHQIPCHRFPPRMEVAIFMDAWLTCLIWHRHNNNRIP